jgi:hypothetical protein
MAVWPIYVHSESPLWVENRGGVVFTVEPETKDGLYGYRGRTVGGYADKDAIMTHVRVMLEQKPTLKVRGTWSSDL